MTPSVGQPRHWRARLDAPLTRLQYVTTDLTHHTEEAAGVLKAVGVLPFDPETYGDDESTEFGSDEEERNYWKYEALDYDSDGCPIDYEV